MNSGIIQPVRSDSILPHWGSIEPLLQSVLDEVDSGHTVEDVLSKLQLTEMQLWCINDWQAIAITTVAILPQHKNLVVLFLSGEGVHDWMHELIDTMHKFAIALECKYVEVYGRDGWRKLLKEYKPVDTLSVMRFIV